MDANHLRQKARYRGFNLIEAAIVLGVVGLVIGAIWVGAASFYQRHRVEQSYSGMLMIGNKIGKIYSDAGLVSEFALAAAELHGMVGNSLPAGFTLEHSTGFSSPLFELVGAGVRCEDADSYCTVSVRGFTSDYDACVAFGVRALAALGRGEITGVYLAGVGGSYIEAGHDDERRLWTNVVPAAGAPTLIQGTPPDPLLAGQIPDCFLAAVAVEY